MENNTVCIYHGNCADGFGAAWAVRKYFKEKYCVEPEFIAGVYQTPPPSVTGKHIILVDFSYKRPVIQQLLDGNNDILIIDHHKSAIQDLETLHHPRLTKFFALENSGAMLTWQWFFPDEEAPQLIKHIEDRDLWKFKLHGTREIQANIFSYPYDFEVWDKLMKEEPTNLAQEGSAIERKHFKDIHELLKVTQHERSIGGYIVPVANLPYTLSSDAGHIMAKDRPFAACYWDVPDGRVFSLRSSDTGVDVSEIAKQYGGGGHKNAAGFKVGKEHSLAQPQW